MTRSHCLEPGVHESRVQKGPPFHPVVAIETDNAGSLSDRAHSMGRDLGSAWLEAHDKKVKQVLDSGTLPLSSAIGFVLFATGHAALFWVLVFFPLSSSEHRCGPNSIVDRISTHLVFLVRRGVPSRCRNVAFVSGACLSLRRDCARKILR